jgi:hypothetical protein
MDADQFLAEHLRFDLGFGTPADSSSATLQNASSISQDDELYLERLDTLYNKHLGEIRAFATRESRPYEDVSRIVCLEA